MYNVANKKKKKSQLISLSFTKRGWKWKQTLTDLGPPSSEGKTWVCSPSCDLSKFLHQCSFRILQVDLVGYLPTTKDLSLSPFENANYTGYEVPPASNHFHWSWHFEAFKKSSWLFFTKQVKTSGDFTKVMIYSLLKTHCPISVSCVRVLYFFFRARVAVRQHSSSGRKKKKGNLTGKKNILNNSESKICNSIQLW